MKSFSLMILCFFVFVFSQKLVASTFKISEINRDNQIKITAEFDYPKITKIREGSYELSLKEMPKTIVGGLPSVPVKTLKIAVPAGREWKRIDVVDTIY